MTSPDSTTRRRVARKSRLCNSCDRRSIKPGQPYLSGTVFPGNDANTTPVPMRLAECGSCAIRYGRAHLLETSR